MKRVLITGIYGQDGSYLCEQLCSEGAEVHGVARRELSPHSCRIKNELDNKGVKPFIHHTDLCDRSEIKKLLLDIAPDEIYHVAAMHHSSVGGSKEFREQNLYNTNTLVTANILETTEENLPRCKVVTAGSCLMYDASDSSYQDASTPFESMSLYGIAKIAENQLVNYYRKKGLFACTAILYNHESHRRGPDYVTQKIVREMLAVKKGDSSGFAMGNIDVMKDWGYAADYMTGMRMMLKQKTPRDYILASGEPHSIREFLSICASKLKIDGWENYVLPNKETIRRVVRGTLVGKPTEIEALGWRRTKDLDDIIEEMIENYSVLFKD